MRPARVVSAAGEWTAKQMCPPGGLHVKIDYSTDDAATSSSPGDMCILFTCEIKASPWVSLNFGIRVCVWSPAAGLPRACSKGR